MIRVTEQGLRPTRMQTFMDIAGVLSKRSTCPRRQVGCVLLDVRGHVIGSGYNGVAAGLPHCTVTPCSGAACPTGVNLQSCEAIHAEANALLQCKDVYAIDTCYVTTSPCTDCAKLLLNTGCKTIIYNEEYVNPTGLDLWRKSGRVAIKL